MRDERAVTIMSDCHFIVSTIIYLTTSVHTYVLSFYISKSSIGYNIQIKSILFDCLARTFDVSVSLNFDVSLIDSDCHNEF